MLIFRQFHGHLLSTNNVAKIFICLDSVVHSNDISFAKEILILVFSFNLIKDYLKIKITLFGTWLNVNQRVLSKGKTESYFVMTKWNVHCKFMLILVINKTVVLLLENSFLMTQNTISFLPFLTFSRIHMDFRIG